MTTLFIILLVLLFWKPLYHAIQIARIEDADSDTYHAGCIRAYFRDLWDLIKIDATELQFKKMLGK